MRVALKLLLLSPASLLVSAGPVPPPAPAPSSETWTDACTKDSGSIGSPKAIRYYCTCMAEAAGPDAPPFAEWLKMKAGTEALAKCQTK